MRPRPPSRACRRARHWGPSTRTAQDECTLNDHKGSRLARELLHAAEEVTGAAATEAIEYERLPPRVWVFSAIMVIVGIVTTALLLKDFNSDSYWYLAFYSIPANTAISVFPHEPVLIYFGKFANLWWTAAAATAGTVAAGYMDHTVFVPVLHHKTLVGYKDKRWYRKAIHFFMRYPFATIVVTGFTPIPFFPFKFLSFSIHYPMWKYLSALVLARFPRYMMLAWIGYEFDIPNWIIFGSFVVIIALYVVKAGPELVRRVRRWRARRAEDRAS